MSALGLLAPHRLGRIVRSDAANVARDPLLLLVLALSVCPALAMWAWAEAMDQAALAAFGLPGLSRYVAPVALVMPAFLIGWVGGFLLLEDRDDGLMPALAVTPTGKTGFMVYRVAAATVMTTLVTVAALPVLEPNAPLSQSVVLVLLVAATGVLAAIVLPAVARNKVEGLALTKLTNLFSLAPLLATIPSPWRYLAGILPTFWIGEAIALPPNPLPLWATALAASAVYALWAVVILRRFIRRVG